MKPLSLLWLRRDLRLDDHAALAAALAEAGEVQPVFLFDTEILRHFPNPEDRRLSFIAETLCRLHAGWKKRGGGLLVFAGNAVQIIPRLAAALSAQALCYAEDYEPFARTRDQAVMQALQGKCRVRAVKDHLLLAPGEILKEGGAPYRVFTPYYRAWLEKLMPMTYAAYPDADKGRHADAAAFHPALHAAGLASLDIQHGPEVLLRAVGYRYAPLPAWSPADARHRLEDFAENGLPAYHRKRDLMAADGTSRLSPYLRFGLLSPRECARRATEMEGEGAKIWLKELAWRDFYASILFFWPESAITEWEVKFREKLDWSRNRAHFDAWREGMTGYPIIDAGMRELNQTGWMHNRMRMVTASFLTKHLRLDWRWGEAHFAQLLMDYDLASNAGGWQWAASTGTDAQPWFRIFNPVLQSKKFDPDGAYIRRYVPELRHLPGAKIHEPWKSGGAKSYPTPVIDLNEGREAALAMFKQALE